MLASAVPAWVAVAQSTRLVNAALNPCLSGGPLPNTHSLLRSRALDSGRHFHCGIASGYHSGHNHIATLSYGTTVKHWLSHVWYLTENLRPSWELENTLEFFTLWLAEFLMTDAETWRAGWLMALLCLQNEFGTKASQNKLNACLFVSRPLDVYLLNIFGLIMWPAVLGSN